MYFLPRSPNRLYTRAAHVSSAYRYGITLCLFGITIAAWFCLIYRPVEAALSAYTIHNGAVHAECKAGSACQKSIHDLTQQVDQLRIMFDTDATQISSCTDWISPVITCAQQAGLTIKAYIAGKDSKKEWYCSTQAQFELSGAHEKLLNFLRDLQKVNPHVGCKQWSITHAQGPLYTMACTLYLFKAI